MTENGRITSEETEIAPYLSQKTEYRYEERSAGGVYPDHRPVEVQNYYHDGTGYSAYPAYCYDYDELGRVVGEGMADRTEFSVQYQYKKRKKLVNGAVTDDTAETNYIEKMSYRRRGWNLGEETYTYDENGNITEIRDGDNISRFWYDGANRIVKELNQYAEVSYEYDEKGNIISTDAQYVNEDVRIPLAIQRYYYTATGGITGFEHSAIVHPGTGQTVFPICTEYNAGGYPLNYLGKAIIWDGSRMAQMGAVKYKYNAEGIRQEKEVNGRKHIYYTQGTKLLAEKITEEGQPDINKQYLYAGEKPIGFVLNGKPYQYLYNGLGNLVRVFDAKTGRIAAEYSYTAFGSCTVTNHTEENIGDQNPIRYKGYYYDEETGLYYLKSRYYSPAYRIFLSPDEPEYMEPSDFSGLNLYTYCYNNPVMYFDPSGTDAVVIILAIVGAIVGAVTVGGAVYYAASNAGVIGDELVTYTIIGAVAGAIVGGLIGYFLPSVLPAVTQGVGFTLPKLIMQGGQLAYTATTVVVSEKIIFQIFATGLTAAELTANILYYQSKKKAPTIHCKSKKEAYDKAFYKGGKRPPRGPEDHGFGRHYNPNGKSKYKHWHYTFSTMISFYMNRFLKGEE